MGNQICCRETRTQTMFQQTQKFTVVKNQGLVGSSTKLNASQNVSIRVPQPKATSTIDNNPQSITINQVKENIKIPELTYQISVVLKTLKFFEEQQAKQTAPFVRKYGEDIYVGNLDESGLKPNDFGKMYKQDKSLYMGYFKDGKAEGKGVYFFANGSHYNGQFHNNYANTTSGEFTSGSIYYKGGFSKNVFEGMGQEQGKSYSFKGHFHNGTRTKGILFWNNNSDFSSYNGQFNEHNQFHGKGVLTQPEGKYQGEFQNGQKHGKGTYYYMKGSKYVGTYVHGVREGQGTIYHGNGKIAYKGSIKNGLPHGKGLLYNKQGRQIESEWIEGIDKRTITE